MIAAPILDDLVDEFERTLAPPPRPRPLLEFCSALRLPDDPLAEGTVPTQFDPTSHPAQFEIAKAFARGGHYEMVVLGPVQDGKTWIVEVVLVLYVLLELRRHVVYACPDRPFCGKMWRSKFLPAIHASGLAHLLPEDGPGSDGGVPDDLLTRCGSRLFLLGAGARNEAGQAGVTAPVVVVGERSSIRSRWVELLFARKEAYGSSGRGISTSTLKHDDEGADSTVSAYVGSTAGRLHFACIHCISSQHPSGGWQTFEWANVEADYTSDEAASATARLHCVHCKHGLTEDDRRACLRTWRLVMRGQQVQPDGTVTGDPPPTKVWGLRWTALDSPLKDLRLLAVQYRQAIEMRDRFGDHDKLIQFTRDKLVAQYRGLIDPTETPRAINREYLMQRSQLGWADSTADRDTDSDLYLWSRHIAPMPAAAEFGDLAIDVQDNRVYWALGAADSEMRTWDACWGFEYATVARDPLSKPELHRLLDRVAELADDLRGELPIIVKCIDVGYHQEWIVEWMRGHPDWLPIAGAGDEAAGHLRRANASGDVPGIIYRHRPDGWNLSGRKLHTVDAGRVRELAQNAYLRPAGAPGAAHLPKGLRVNDTYIKHLCGELLVEDPKTGKRKWKKTPGTRHDYLDLKTYRTAMLRLVLAQAERQGVSPIEAALGYDAPPAAPGQAEAPGVATPAATLDAIDPGQALPPAAPAAADDDWMPDAPGDGGDFIGGGDAPLGDGGAW